MESKTLSFEYLIGETHLGLERQGPGSTEMTIKALSFIDNLDENSRIADLGCGTGGQTIALAKNITGTITGVDILPAFIDRFHENMKKVSLSDRVSGIIASMDSLPFQKEEFDLIWSEGAVDNIGFEKGLHYWNGFLKSNGYVAVSSPSWLTDQRPAEVEKFWLDAGSCGLATVEDHSEAMQNAGFSFVGAFTLHETCWTDHYFTPREMAGKVLLENHKENKDVEDFIAEDKREV